MADENRSPSRFQIGDLILDTGAHTLTRNGDEIQLTRLTFALFATLVRHAPNLMTQDELLTEVWGDVVVGDEALKQRIKVLREAIGDVSDTPRYVATVRGLGYRLIAPVKVLSEEGPLDVGGTRETALSFSRITIVIVLLIATTVGLFYLIYPQTETQTAEGSQVAIPEVPKNSIAVLPFVNVSDDASNEYFSDGISEELLNLLTKIPGLRVISRTSAFSYKGKGIDLPTIAEQLNVGHVLEGSVRKAGNQVRVTAQLIEARSDTHLWSETYERTLDDIFVIQDEIAEAVVDALKLTLLGDTPRVLETAPEAYALYLQSRSLATQRTTDSLLQAEALVKRALEIDNEYTPAWVQLGEIYTFGPGIGSWHPNEALPMARAAAMEALRLDANSARAHAILSRVARSYDYDIETAIKEQQIASTLAPSDSDIQGSASVLAYFTGDYDETIRLGEEAALGDPLNLQTKLILGFGYSDAGRIDEAMSVFREMIALNPLVGGAHFRLGQTLLIRGDYDAALEEMDKELRDGHRIAGRALVFQAMGDSERAAAELDELIALGYRWTYEIAMVHAYRGELDEAFTWLDRAIDRRDLALILILGDPFLDNLRDDSRFDSVLERLGHKAP